MILSRRYTGLLFVFYICGVCKLTTAVDRVHLREVQVLTLYKGKMTNGRRSSPVPQLECTGGTAGCSAFIPNVVQCYNKGFDGYDSQWECKTDMDNKYRFGHISVNCEGYEYPDDPYILRGSCGLQYSIDLTEEGYRKQRSSYGSSNNYHHGNGYRRSSMNSNGFGDLVMLVIVGGIIYMIYSTYKNNRDRDTGAAPPPYPEQPGPADTPPPPYNRPDEPGFKKEYTQGSTPPPIYQEEPGLSGEYAQGASGTTSSAGTSAGTSNSGFWTGAASGGLLGYLFGSRGTGGNRYYQHGYGSGGWGSSYYNNPYNQNTNSGFFGNLFGGRSSYGHRPSNYGFSSFGGSSGSGGSYSSSSGSRTASGVGGTSRR